MADNTNIEWCDATWNPILGCRKCATGCKNCYAVGHVHRMAHNPNEKIRNANAGLVKDGNWTGEVRLIPSRLDIPRGWGDARVIFVCSLSDLFHPHMADAWLDKVFAVMALCPRHKFIVLTKRPERMRQYMEGAFQRVYDASCFLNETAGERTWDQWPFRNVWLGASASTQADLDSAAPHLMKLAKAGWKTFFSFEPLVGPVDVKQYLPSRYWCCCGYKGDETGPHYCEKCQFDGPNMDEIADECCPVCGDNITTPACPDCGEITPFGLWDIGPEHARPPVVSGVIVGGESGHGPDIRPMHPDWARQILDDCKEVGVPFFFKQWGEWVVPDLFPVESQIRSIVKSMAYDDPRLRYIDYVGKTYPVHLAPCSAYLVARLGKKQAGRLLDGRTHIDELPWRAKRSANPESAKGD